MATPGGDVEFKFTANAAPVVAELAKVQGAAQQTAAATVTSVGKIKSAFADTGTAAAGASSNIGRAATSLGALGGIVSRVNPQIGAMVSSIGTLASSGQGLLAAGASIGSIAAIAGPAVVVIAALALAWKHYADELEAAEAIQARFAAQAEAASVAHEKLTGTEKELSDALLKYGTREEQAKVKLEERTKAINDSIDAQTRSLAAVGDQIVAGREQEALEVRRKRDLAEAQALYKKDAEGRAEVTKAIKVQTVAIDEEGAAAAKNASVYKDALAAIMAAEDEATTSQLDDIGQVEASRDAQLATLKAREDAALAVTQEGTSAREVVEQAYHDAVVAMNADAAKKIEKIEDARFAAADKQIEDAGKAYDDWLQHQADQTRATNVSIANSASDLAGTLSRGFYATAQAQADAGEKGSLANFRAGQALAEVQIAISTIVAGIQAYAQLGPVAGSVAAIAIGAAGIAAAAEVAAQKPPSTRHYGGAIYPDEATVKMRSGESVLTPSATSAFGGPAGVAQANRDAASGLSGGGGSLSLHIGRYAFREGLRGDVRAGGVIAQEIDRRANRSGLRPGVSGKLAVA